MKSVMLYVHEDDGLEARFQAALDVTRALGGHLACVQTLPFQAFVTMDPFGGVYGLPELYQQANEQLDAVQARIEQRLGREVVPWDWTREDGAGAQALIESSRLADLIVVSQGLGGRDRNNQPLDLVAEVAVNARAPVLAVPPAAKGLDSNGTAVIAWNGSFEAAQALRLAIPLLRLASAVRIVTVTDDDIAFPPTDASTYLSRHGIGSELVEWPRGNRAVAEALKLAANDLDADYLVLGAYGHSRIRELILGGVTQAMLEDSAIPLLLAH